MAGLEAFFRRLPDPQADMRYLEQHGKYDSSRMPDLMAHLSNATPQSPVHAELLARVPKLPPPMSVPPGVECLGLQQLLAELALAHPELLDGNSATARQLRYFRWIAQGKRDEECPFPRSGTSQEQSNINHAVVPNTVKMRCAGCGKSDDLMRCSGCAVTAGSHLVLGTMYCSKACQTAHWHTHKSVCVCRKEIHRAVVLAYDLLVMFHTKAFNYGIGSIEERNGVLYVNKDMSVPGAFLKGASMLLRPLQRDLFASDDHFLATIFEYKSSDFASCAKRILDVFLLPFCRSLQEWGFDVRNARLPTCQLSFDGEASYTMFDRNMMLRAELRSGETVAIDFAGARFGWSDVLTPWDSWVAHRGVGMGEGKQFGDYFQEMQLLIPRVNENIARVIGGRQSLANTVEKSRKDFLGQKNLTAKAFCKLPAEQFSDTRAQMLSTVQQALDARFQRMVESRCYQMYFDRNWNVCFVDSQQQGEALDGVWLTEEEAERRGNDPQQLKKLWIERCRGARKQALFKRVGLNMAS